MPRTLIGLVVGGALAATSFLPRPDAWLLCLIAIIVLGVPHGALDGEVARPLTRPRFGRFWFAAFSAPYLALAALVLLAWRWAPMGTLAAFLAASVWHFGSEDPAADGVLSTVALGGLPIAVPVLVHPAGTAAVLSTVSLTKFAAPPAWLDDASLVWAALALVWLLGRPWRRDPRVIGHLATVVALFALLRPLAAFAVYFVCVHAPAHVTALIADPVRAPRVHDTRTALGHAIPVTLLTLAIGAALWPLYPGAEPSRLLALTIQGLSALTLPHMLLDAYAGWQGRRSIGAAARDVVTARSSVPPSLAR